MKACDLKVDMIEEDTQYKLVEQIRERFELHPNLEIIDIKYTAYHCPDHGYHNERHCAMILYRKPEEETWTD